ncbi:MAG: DNRLRE domain-containing protein [Phycisphaerales bacterium]
MTTLNVSARAFGCAVALAGSLLLAPAAQAQQQTVILTADRDNTLYQDTQGDVSNGAGTFFFTGLTNNGDIRRGLVRFNLSSIPAGSTINSATLSLTCSRVNTNTGRATSIHRASADWGQGTSDATQGGEGQGAVAATNDATWLHRFFNTQLWAAQGGDFVAAASATTTVGATGTYSWTGANVLADVQAWYASPATNFGWLVRGVENVSGSAKRFNTREFGTANQRPQLTVVFTPPAPATGACCTAGVCTIVTSAACSAGGGVYQGDNAPCSPGLCPEPTGACCVSGACSVLTPTACAAAGGTYQGNGIACSPDPCSAATIVTVGATKDNTLYQTTGGTLSNGIGQGFVVGTGAAANNRRRGLVAFNLSSIPAGAIVTDVRLRLVLGAEGDNATRTINVHRVLADWGEGISNAPQNEFGGATSTTNDATWIHRFFNAPNWTTQGGDFVPTASAGLAVGTALQAYEWSSAGLVNDVQGWISNPATNFGWLLANANEATLNTQRRFESLQNGTIADRPALIITYSLPPATGACCDASGSCTVLTASACGAAGGSYSGDNTTCSPNLCPQPTGACCLTSGLCVSVTASDCAAQGGDYRGNGTLCSGVDCPLLLTPFVDPLPIPAVAQPAVGQAGGAAHYNIPMVEFMQKLHRDLPDTRLWGYAGTYPGPTIEARTGQTVTVNWMNDLRDTAASGALRTTHLLPVDTCLHGPNVNGQVPFTVVHLHGAKVAPESDGNPDFAFPPGQSDLYTYPNNQRASTMWYHDHALGLTRLNVYLGLAAFYFIRDDAEDALNLPRGEFEIPLVIQDRSFNPDGSLDYNQTLQDHFFGKFILVNGKVWPFLSVKQGKYRFRLLNGSNTRFYTLALEGGATFHQIGSDLGLLPAPAPITSITLSPSERADIVIDFAGLAPGTRVTLLNSAPAPFPVGEPVNDVANVMQFVVQAAPGDTDPLPATLVPVPPIAEAGAAQSRTWTLRSVFETACNHDMWLINDLGWDDVTDFPRLGTTEVWSFVNRSQFSHPMHVHLVSFQVLDRQPFSVVNNEITPTGPRVPPPPGEAGWKDTVQAHPFEITRVIMHFDDFHGLYPIHCHILEHEDHEMMRQWDLQCEAPAIGTHPQPAAAPLGGAAAFSLAATGDVLKYQWFRGNVALADGLSPTGSIVSGSTTPSLSITGVQPGDYALYRCEVQNPCGSATSTAAALTAACAADFNQDGNLDPDDLGDFINCFFSAPPCPGADFNQDANVDPDDLGDFINAFFGGC